MIPRERGNVSLAGVDAACVRRRKRSDGRIYAYLSCHYVIALQVRNRPSKRAALFRRNHQSSEEEGRTSHYNADAPRSRCPPSLLSRVHSRKVSLSPSPLLLRSYPLFLFLSFEREGETRCDTWGLAGWLASWIHC